jgi:hypothetical protein
MVEVEQSSAKPLGFMDGSVPATRWGVGKRYGIVKFLMIAV